MNKNPRKTTDALVKKTSAPTLPDALQSMSLVNHQPQPLHLSDFLTLSEITDNCALCDRPTRYLCTQNQITMCFDCAVLVPFAEPAPPPISNIKTEVPYRSTPDAALKVDYLPASDPVYTETAAPRNSTHTTFVSNVIGFDTLGIPGIHVATPVTFLAAQGANPRSTVMKLALKATISSVPQSGNSLLLCAFILDLHVSTSPPPPSRWCEALYAGDPLQTAYPVVCANEDGATRPQSILIGPFSFAAGNRVEISESVVFSIPGLVTSYYYGSPDPCRLWFCVASQPYGPVGLTLVASSGQVKLTRGSSSNAISRSMILGEIIHTIPHPSRVIESLEYQSIPIRSGSSGVNHALFNFMPPLTAGYHTLHITGSLELTLTPELFGALNPQSGIQNQPFTGRGIMLFLFVCDPAFNVQTPESPVNAVTHSELSPLQRIVQYASLFPDEFGRIVFPVSFTLREDVSFFNPQKQLKFATQFADSFVFGSLAPFDLKYHLFVSYTPTSGELDPVIPPPVDSPFLPPIVAPQDPSPGYEPTPSEPVSMRQRSLGGPTNREMHAMNGNLDADPFDASFTPRVMVHQFSAESSGALLHPVSQIDNTVSQTHRERVDFVAPGEVWSHGPEDFDSVFIDERIEAALSADLTRFGRYSVLAYLERDRDCDDPEYLAAVEDTIEFSVANELVSTASVEIAQVVKMSKPRDPTKPSPTRKDKVSAVAEIVSNRRDKVNSNQDAGVARSQALARITRSIRQDFEKPNGYTAWLVVKGVLSRKLFLSQLAEALSVTASSPFSIVSLAYLTAVVALSSNQISSLHRVLYSEALYWTLWSQGSVAPPSDLPTRILSLALLHGFDGQDINQDAFSLYSQHILVLLDEGAGRRAVEAAAWNKIMHAICGNIDVNSPRDDTEYAALPSYNTFFSTASSATPGAPTRRIWDMTVTYLGTASQFSANRANHANIGSVEHSFYDPANALVNQHVSCAPETMWTNDFTGGPHLGPQVYRDILPVVNVIPILHPFVEPSYTPEATTILNSAKGDILLRDNTFQSWQMSTKDARALLNIPLSTGNDFEAMYMKVIFLLTAYNTREYGRVVDLPTQYDVQLTSGGTHKLDELAGVPNNIFIGHCARATPNSRVIDPLMDRDMLDAQGDPIYPYYTPTAGFDRVEPEMPSLYFHLTLDTIPEDQRGNALFLDPSSIITSNDSTLPFIPIQIMAASPWPFMPTYLSGPVRDVLNANRYLGTRNLNGFDVRVPGFVTLHVLLPSNFPTRTPATAPIAMSLALITPRYGSRPPLGPNATPQWVAGAPAGISHGAGLIRHNLLEYLLSWFGNEGLVQRSTVTTGHLLSFLNVLSTATGSQAQVISAWERCASLTFRYPRMRTATNNGTVLRAPTDAAFTGRLEMDNFTPYFSSVDGDSVRYMSMTAIGPADMYIPFFSLQVLTKYYMRAYPTPSPTADLRAFAERFSQPTMLPVMMTFARMLCCATSHIFISLGLPTSVLISAIGGNLQNGPITSDVTSIYAAPFNSSLSKSNVIAQSFATLFPGYALLSASPTVGWWRMIASPTALPSPISAKGGVVTVFNQAVPCLLADLFMIMTPLKHYREYSNPPGPNMTRVYAALFPKEMKTAIYINPQGVRFNGLPYPEHYFDYALEHDQDYAPHAPAVELLSHVLRSRTPAEFDFRRGEGSTSLWVDVAPDNRIPLLENVFCLSVVPELQVTTLPQVNAFVTTRVFLKNMFCYPKVDALLRPLMVISMFAGGVLLTRALTGVLPVPGHRLRFADIQTAPYFSTSRSTKTGPSRLAGFLVSAQQGNDGVSSTSPQVGTHAELTS